MSKIFLLLFLFQVKHFLADYPLQNSYMLGKFKDGFHWIVPLSSHCAVHAFFTFWICVFFTEPFTATLLAVFDFVAHFTMDRIKASPNVLGRFKAISKTEVEDFQRDLETYDKATYPELVIYYRHRKYDFEQRMKQNKYFWWSLGIDQGFHHLTHYIIIWWVVK